MVLENQICWKHKRMLFSDGTCRECNGIPPNKPKAYADTIKEASIKLSYAFNDISNELERQKVAEYWERELRSKIKRDYEIIDMD